MADLTINPASVVPPAANTTVHLQTPQVLTGEAIAAGETVCLLENNTYWRGDANDTTKQDIKGIAGNSAPAAGQRLDVIIQSPALEVGAHGVAVGIPLYQSSNPGKICPYADLSSGALPVLVAFAASATTLQVVIAAAQNAKP